MDCISCLMVCKIFLCSEFPEIPEEFKKEKKKMAIPKRYAFQANAINDFNLNVFNTLIVINKSVPLVKHI